MMAKMDETAGDPRDPEAMVKAFLQYKSMEQMQDYLTRGRRFAKLDVAQLNADWIIAVRSWLAHNDRANERKTDGLAHSSRTPREWPQAFTKLCGIICPSRIV